MDSAHLLLTLATAALPPCIAAVSSGADQSTRPIPANTMAELAFSSSVDCADPFNEVELNVVFTAPDGVRVRVPAFWAGGRSWRARYSSPLVGTHRYRSECSDANNAGLHAQQGQLEVAAYPGDNPLYKHGAVRVAADRRHFEHADGTPFLWLADTWWMGLCQRLTWPDDFKRLAADRHEKGFNVVQIVAGLYPDMPAFDERGRGDAGFPWEKDYSRINPAYFDAADRRLAWLVESGFSPCIVGAWGYHLPWVGVERMKKHWRYLVARYGAWPVVWCIAGEGEMPYYLSKQREQDQAFQKKGWTEVADCVRKLDPYHRLVTIHPTTSARSNVTDVAVLDFDMLQTGHGGRDSIPNTIRMVRESRAASPTLPTVVGEVCYEGILGTCFEDIQRYMVWSCLLSGTAGHTYGANGIWQVNREGQPYGASPHGGNWGNTPWDEAMTLPGSQQAGIAKRLLEAFPWSRFEPHPEWASPASPSFPPASWGDWIWYPEGNPAEHAPAERRFFRKTFDIPPGKRIVGAIVRLAVDDKFTAYINGTRIGSQHNWRTAWQSGGIGHLLGPGANILAVEAENIAAPVPRNPAGLLCSLHLRFTDATDVVVLSDGTWRCARSDAPGWHEVGFDDKAWAPALRVAKYGDAPWGAISAGPDEFMAPYAAGVPGVVRVIYLPTSEPVVVRGLEAHLRHQACYLDPVTGQRTELGPVSPGKDSLWAAPAPPKPGQDWVLILEAR